MARVEALTEDRLKELERQPGVRVIRTRDRPPTVKDRSELWDPELVKTWLLALAAARERHDREHERGEMTPAERAWAIASTVCPEPARVMEFRRIYPTIWRYALARTGTTRKVLEELCLIVEEAKHYLSEVKPRV